MLTTRRMACHTEDQDTTVVDQGGGPGKEDRDGRSAVGQRGAGGVVVWPCAGRCGSGAGADVRQGKPANKRRWTTWTRCSAKLARLCSPRQTWAGEWRRKQSGTPYPVVPACLWLRTQRSTGPGNTCLWGRHGLAPNHLNSFHERSELQSLLSIVPVRVVLP